MAIPPPDPHAWVLYVTNLILSISDNLIVLDYEGNFLISWIYLSSSAVSGRTVTVHAGLVWLNAGYTKPKTEMGDNRC